MMRKPPGVVLEEDKYEIKGWNNDIDENFAGSNLLKILEKKITIPFLQKTINLKPRSQHKLETLPTVMPLQKNSILQRELDKYDMDQEAEIFFHEQDLCGSSLKKNKSHKIKVNEKNEEVNEKKQIVPQEHVWVNNQSFFDLMKKENSFKNEFKRDKSLKEKPKNLKSVPSLSIQENQFNNQKSILPKFYPHINENNAQLSNKTLRWDKFHSSTERYDPKLIIKRNQPHKMEYEELKVREGSLKVRKKNKLDQEIDLKTIWMKNVLEKTKTKELTSSIMKPRITKTEAFDFMDKHLQSP